MKVIAEDVNSGEKIVAEAVAMFQPLNGEINVAS